MYWRISTKEKIRKNSKINYQKPPKAFDIPLDNPKKEQKKKKKKTNESASVEISKEFFISLLEILNLSNFVISQKTYRKLLTQFTEALILIDYKSKNLFNNKDLIYNFLASYYKLIIKKNIIIKENEIQNYLGIPEIYPLKPNFEKNLFYSKGELVTVSNPSKSEYFYQDNLLSIKNIIFSNKKDFFLVLNMLKAISLSFEKHLSGDFSQSLSKMITNFKINQLKKQTSKLLKKEQNSYLEVYESCKKPNLNVFERLSKKNSLKKIKNRFDKELYKKELDTDVNILDKSSVKYLRKNKSVSSIADVDIKNNKSKDKYDSDSDDENHSSILTRMKKISIKSKKLKISQSSAYLKMSEYDKEIKKPPMLRKINKNSMKEIISKK